MTSIHRPLKLQLFIRVILARGVWKPVGMSAACEADVSWIIACPSNFAYLTSVLGLEIASACHFRNWVFEAFDGQLADWRVLYDSDGVSPWTIQSGTIQSGGWGAHILFPVEPSFPSSRFRIRLTNGFEHQCMHIRGFELFGAILPPWRIDA